MTISSTANRVSYSGNGVTTAFSFPYLFLVEADLIVVLRSALGVETTKTLTTHYTTSGAGVQAGGTVTMITAPAVGETLVIYRDPALTQDLDLVENDPLPVEPIEKRLDKLTMFCQRLKSRVDRSIVLKETDVQVDLTIPLFQDRTGQFIFFDYSGSLQSGNPIDTSLVPVSTFMQTVVAKTTAAAARTALGVTTSLYNVLDNGLTGDGVTDDSTALNTLIASLTSGATLFFPPGTYKLSNDITIAVANIGFSGSGKASKLLLADGKKIACSVSGVSVDRLWIDGTLYSTGTTSGKLLSFTGASSAAYISDIKVTNCHFTNATFYGIYAEFIQHFVFANNTFDDMFYAAIGINSSQFGNVSGNVIRDILGSDAGNSYGIFFSKQSGALATYPRCKDIVCSKNVIENNATWEGLDTHAGQGIIFDSNVVRNCKIGISVGETSNGFPPLQCVVSNNVVDSAVTDGSASYGISVTGESTTPLYALGCVVKGNVIKGYGAQSVATSAAVYCRTTVGLIVQGNTVIEPSPYAFVFETRNYGLSLTNNVVVDPFSNTLGVAEAGIARFISNNHTGIVQGNVVTRADKSASYLNNMGFRFDSSSTGINLDILGQAYHGSVSTYFQNFPAGIVTQQNKRQFRASATPASTSPWLGMPWIVGDIAWALTPVAGQPIGWMCTVAGTPGTWVALANL